MSRVHLSLPPFTAIAWAMVCLLAAAWSAPAAWAQDKGPAIVQASWGGSPVARGDTLTLEFARTLDELGALVIVIGREDVTAQFKPAGPRRLEGRFDQAPLPVGDHEVQVMQVHSPSDWQTLITLPLSVTERQPALSLAGSVGLKGQGWSEHAGVALPPARPTYTDATSQITLIGEQGNEALGAKGSWQLMGTSFQREAVRFPVEGPAAPKPDLISYTLEGHAETPLGRTVLSMGQVNTAAHPLLAPTLGHRGITVSQALGPAVDWSLGVQAGAQVLGAHNLSGTEDARSQFTTARVGVELLPDRAGALRFELGWFAGRIAPAPPLTIIPPVIDTQHSHGWGWRVAGSTEDGRLTADLSSAVSRYRAENDALASDSGAKRAHAANLNWQVLPPTEIGDLPAELSLTLRQEHSDALFQSLGGGPIGDFQGRSLGLNGMLGVLMAGLNIDTTEDNVADDALFEKNRSRTTTLQMALPSARLPGLSRWVTPGLEAAWPQWTWSVMRMRSWGDARFLPDGMLPDDLAYTLSTEHKMGLQWTLPRWTLAWRLLRSGQDNRQALLADQDLQGRGHQIDATWRPRTGLSLAASMAHQRLRMLDTGERTHTRHLGLDARWSPGPAWQWVGAWTRQQSLLALGPTLTTYDTLQLGLHGKTSLSTWAGRPLTGLWFLRLAWSHNRAEARDTGLSTQAELQALQTGFNLAF